jgi:outer membrane protein assembly factor BamB
LYISNGYGNNNPAIWKMNWDGLIVDHYTADYSYTFSGTLSVRNGEIYIYNDFVDPKEFYAISESTHTTLWTAMITADDYSGGPIVWSQDESFFVFGTYSDLVALNASNGAILWITPLVQESYFDFLPIVYSKVDDSLVWMTDSQELIKVSMNSGTEIWRNSHFKEGSNSNGPIGVAIDDAGYIYGAEPYNYNVFKIDQNGNLVWSTILDYKPAYSSACLTSEHLFIIDNSQGFVWTFDINNGTAYLAYENSDPTSGTINKWITGQLFWNDNVLYGSFQGVIAAYNTTDPFHLEQLWTIETGAGESTLGGVAIASDGTMFLASTMYDAEWPFLTAVGCPVGLHLKSDGTSCIPCYPGYVFNSNTCEKCAEGTYSNEGDETCSPCSEDPTNEQCITPPTAVPIAVPSAVPSSGNEPSAEVPVAVAPGSAPVGSTTPKGKTNTATSVVLSSSLLGLVFLCM